MPRVHLCTEFAQAFPIAAFAAFPAASGRRCSYQSSIRSYQVYISIPDTEDVFTQCISTCLRSHWDRCYSSHSKISHLRNPTLHQCRMASSHHYTVFGCIVASNRNRAGRTQAHQAAPYSVTTALSISNPGLMPKGYHWSCTHTPIRYHTTFIASSSDSSNP